MTESIQTPPDGASLLAQWAPDDSVWTPWVKAVPFAFWPRLLKSSPTPLRAAAKQAPFLRHQSGRALVIDLPGGEAVRCGALLAQHGYRPVPIFTSRPIDPELRGFKFSAVDADEIITALAESANAVSSAQLAPDAPPAFLVDVTRLAPDFTLRTDFFDNRSAVFASDFPSASTLVRHGIAEVTLVHDPAFPLGEDLLHALDQWHRAGLRLQVENIAGTALVVQWPARTWVRTLWLRVRLLLLLRPNFGGGYGRFVAQSSGG